jgi:hypothetical protein
VCEEEWGYKKKMEEMNLGYTVSVFVNVTMYPQYNYNMLINRKITNSFCSSFIIPTISNG